jgi:H+/Cl- antiporter ClcA
MTGDYFVYCYLIPFLVGAFAILATIGAVVGICGAISKVYNWVIYGASPKARLRVDRIVEWSNKWLLPVLVVAFCIFILIILIFGVWGMGLELLERVECR